MDIQNAINAGFSPQYILNMLGRVYPKFSRGIQNAISAGYSAEKVIGFLSKKGLHGLDQFAGSQNERSEDPYPGANPYIETNRNIERNQQMPEGVKTAGKLALGAAGVASLGALAPRLAAGIASSTIERAVPSAMRPAARAIAEKLGAAAAPGAAAAETGAPMAAAKMAAPMAAQAAKSNPREIFQSLGILDQVNNIARALNPRDVADVIEQHFLKPPQRKWLKEQTGETIQSLVERLVQEGDQAPVEGAQPAEEQILAEQMPENGEFLPEQALENENILEEIEPAIEPEKAEKKKRPVILPDGELGEVEGVKNGIAKITVNGSERHRKQDELAEIDQNMADLGRLYDEMVAKIPEKHRSGPMTTAGYDEDSNELVVTFHDGDIYTYKDIPAEFVEKLKNALFRAKTTGSNYYGAWERGGESRFAGISEIINQLRASGENRYHRKFKKVYDYYEAPRSASKKLRGVNEKRKKMA